MGWLSDLDRIAKRNDGPKTIRRKPEVVRIFTQVRAATDGDPGEVEENYFTLVEGQLTITDRRGKAIEGIKPHVMRDGDQPHSIARALVNATRGKRLGLTDFNRPLGYSSGGVV